MSAQCLAGPVYKCADVGGSAYGGSDFDVNQVPVVRRVPAGDPAKLGSHQHFFCSVTIHTHTHTPLRFGHRLRAPTSVCGISPDSPRGSGAR